MTLRPVLVNMKALDDSAVGRFWGEALGRRVTSQEAGATAAQPVGFDWLDPATVRVDVIAVPEAKTATKNRLHLDLATTSAAHQAELVARLKALGATPAGVGQGNVPWTALADTSDYQF
jgi:hypothetical protein